jgi:hypothetical protein
VQTSLATAPAVVEYLPTAQLTQLALPLTELNLPAAQETQVVELLAPVVEE